MRIEVFADVVCPFTHVGLRRLTDARRERGLKTPVRIHAWPLEWVNGHPLDGHHAAREIEALRDSVAAELFGGFSLTTWPDTSIPAFGLIANAYAHDDATGEAVSLAVRDALFEQGRDIADGNVLRHIGAPYGVTPLDRESAQAATRRDWERGRDRLVRGSPHFFVGNRNWFCPSLAIKRRGATFDIALADETMRDFYEAALA
jgi:predicted DsbA family dithiol-disulfide isomerase